MSLTERLESLLAAGADSAQLRYGLAAAYRKEGKLEAALEHARLAVAADPDYSAAWRLLGQLQASLGKANEAKQTFREGISVAERHGDRQLVKEMGVFLKRLEKQR
jgi:Tfp pilus assembly protein PilF